MPVEKEQVYSRFWNNHLSKPELRTLIVQLCLDDELHQWFSEKFRQRATEEKNDRASTG
jgi:hypothetical protein